VGSTGSINISNTGTITGSGFGLILGGAQGGTLSSILGTGSGSLTKEGTGTWTLMGASTYTGSTIINAGILQLGTADRISNSSNMVLNGGTFSTGAAAGYTETIGKLTLSNNSIIALGPGPHTLTFADSHGETWTGTLTITGWTGTLGTSGSEGKISFSSSGGLLETQLAKIKFLISGSFYTAAMLSTGEVVPSTNLVAGYWLGTISSAWENTGNWNGGSSTSSPVIPSLGVVNNPTISWFVNITSLENQSGRTLTVGTGGALVASTVTNSGTIAISPTGKATINGLTNNGALNLNSDATGIASLIFDSYSGNGTANVQLYLTGGGGPMYKWHYITVPFTTGLSKSFFTDLNGDGTLDNNNLQAYDEFRVNTSTIQGWLWHNGEAHGVLAAGTAFSSLNYGKGYNFYHSSASRTITLSAASPLGTSLSIAYLDFTSSSDATLHGYNLLGNSLTCSIDWDYVIFGENVGHTVYFTTDNQWVSYLSGPGGANGATHYIPPLQGFFVKAEADNAEINFTSSYIRAHQSSQLRYKKSENDQAETKEEIVYPKVKLELSGTSTSDETIVWFNNEATTGYDLKYDGYKLFSSGDALGQFYSTLGGVNYVFNGLPLPTDSTIVPLGVKIAQAGNYSILKKVLEKLDNYNVYLIDKTNGNYTVDLKKADKYNFISDAGTFDNRFVLNFVSLTTSAEAPSVVSKNFNIYSTKSFINILPPDDFAGGSDGSVRIYDLTGRIIKQFKNLGLYEGTLVQIPFTGRQGIYIVEITSGISRYKGKVSVR
jgi:autotransporter-associated beta strand protein